MFPRFVRAVFGFVLPSKESLTTSDFGKLAKAVEARFPDATNRGVFPLIARNRDGFEAMILQLHGPRHDVEIVLTHTGTRTPRSHGRRYLTITASDVAFRGHPKERANYKAFLGVIVEAFSQLKSQHAFAAHEYSLRAWPDFTQPDSPSPTEFVFGLMLFGPTLVSKIGRDRILGLPVGRVGEIAGGYLVELDEDSIIGPPIEEPASEEEVVLMRREIADGSFEKRILDQLNSPPEPEPTEYEDSFLTAAEWLRLRYFK